MAKTSALDKAIAELGREIDVLQLAQERLVAQRPVAKPKAKRGPLAVPKDETQVSS